MRKAALGLALLASAQLTLQSTAAFADDAKASITPTEDSSGGGSSSHAQRKKTGWIILGVGGAVTVAGIVIDIVGATQSSNLAGQGGSGDSGTTQNSRTNLYWGGTALIVAGVVTGIVGGSMVWAKPSPPTGRDHTSDDAQIDNVTKTAAAAAQATPSFTLPLVGATF
jgi:hypothetical protein